MGVGHGLGLGARLWAVVRFNISFMGLQILARSQHNLGSISACFQLQILARRRTAHDAKHTRSAAAHTRALGGYMHDSLGKAGGLATSHSQATQKEQQQSLSKATQNTHATSAEASSESTVTI